MGLFNLRFGPEIKSGLAAKVKRWWYYPTPSEGWGHGGTPRNSKSKGSVPKLTTDSVELLKELCFGLSRVLFAGDVSLKWSDRGGIIVKITLDMEESMKNVLRGSEPEAALKRKVLQWVISKIFSFRLFRPDQSQISSP